MLAGLFNFFNNLSVRYKLFISYIIVIIIPLSVLGAYSYGQAKRFLLNEARHGLGESVKQIADNLNFKFSRYNNTISFLVFNNQVIQVVNNEDLNYYKMSINFLEIKDRSIKQLKG